VTRTAAAVVAIAPAIAAAGDAASIVPSVGTSLGGVLLSLGLVLALIFALAWVLRRLQFARAGGGHTLDVLAQLALGPRERILLLRVGERQALIGVSPAGVQSLRLLDVADTLPVANIAADRGGPGAPALQQRLRELLERRRG
jgi:flagellar protein FliO/FliZ